MAKKYKVEPQFKNYRVTIVENDTMRTYPVIDIIEDNLEYEHGILAVSDAKKYFDEYINGIHYMFNLDLPAKVEASNLKTLRRSMALNNIFKYDRFKKFDLIGFMPWIIIIALVLFK